MTGALSADNMKGPFLNPLNVLLETYRMIKYRRTVFKDNTRTITIHNTLRWNTGSMEYEKEHVFVEKKSQNLKKKWIFLVVCPKTCWLYHRCHPF